MILNELSNHQLLEDDVKNQLIDFVWKAIDGQLKQEQLMSNLNELKEKYGKQFESLLADVISIIDVEMSSFSPQTTNSIIICSNNGYSSDLLKDNDQTNISPFKRRDKFYSIVNYMRPLIGDDLLKERLDIETLENLKLIAKKEVFNQKYIKIKTRLFYKQQKFNLLREESEGYSKLVIELNQTNLNKRILENIQSLIGCFNLDPNRVLDIILESFENNPNLNLTFLGLLKHYKADDETICQIIGFKFQSLHQLNLQNKLEDQQDSLYLITSYLLMHKIIDLESLTPHLYPTEQQIQQSYKDDFESARQYAKKLTTINLSETNQNENIPSQLDDTGPKSSTTSTQTTTVQLSSNVQQQLKDLKEQPRLENQKVNLLKSLIEIGDYKTALKLIEKLPQWYLATFYEQSKSICKSLDRNFIDKMYKKYNLLSKYLRDKLFNQNQNSKTKLKNENDMDLDLDSTDNTENLFDTFLESILPILTSLGPSLSYDPILFTKLIRICVSFLDSKKFTSSSSSSSIESQADQKESSPPPQSVSSTPTQNMALLLSTLSKSELDFYNQIYTLLNEVFLPSLSMITMNPCQAIELWNLLKLFPYEMRYNLYNSWRLSTYKHFPSLIRARAECQEKIKYLLKRLTKENVKIHGRQIGKLSHNNPIIVCDYILGQIQRFDNFILPVVESLKFMTPLSYDVLSYSIIVALSDPDKDKMKHDSTNISSWLQSIANFCALTFKKYPIELIAMIQYVIDQLKMKKSHDLLILQEIVQKMSGIEVLSEVNDLQLEAMAGGDILRQEAGYFNPIRNIKKCANRLKEALADHGLILPLCILLSQQRDYIVFEDKAEREKQMYKPDTEKRHLKLIGSFYDQSQDSLVQFSQFLSSTLTTEEYIHIFPKIDELVHEYHVSPDIAFFLSRPMYAHHIQSKYDELRRIDRSTKSSEKPSKTQRYLESIEYVMQPVIDLSKSLHPAKIWEDMSPLFYTTFWTLSMSDCFVPANAYEKQRQSLKQKLNSLDDNLELTSTKKKKEKEKLLIMLDKLNEEESKQKDHVQHVRARFEKEKDCWFPQKSKTKNETITVFLQLCIFSRCLFTQIDAYYCAKFIQIIHSLKTPNFSTIICYDRIFSDISYSIASLTDNEARRYGRFLLGLLETVMNWHSDQNIFESECANHPGFLTVFRNTLNSVQTNVSNKQEQLDYENFRHVCHKWHYKLTKSFIVCLESEEYLQMRNSLIILTKILPHYPKLNAFCSALEKRVDKIKQTEKDKRQDIFTLASAYLGQLKQRKSFMVDESKFHLKEQVQHHQQADSTISSTKQSRQTSDSSKFKQPSNPTKSTNGSSSKQSAITNSSSTSSSTSVSTQQITSKSSKKDKEKESTPTSTTTTTTSSQPQTQSQSQSNGTSSNRVSASTENAKTGSSPPPLSKSGTTSQSNGASKTTSSSKRSASSSQLQLPSTPTRNGNGNYNEDYSPASSVSSDDFPVSSPKRENQHHSRSQSPVSKNYSYSKTSEQKVKRAKTDDQLSSSQSQNGQTSSSQSSSSSKRKSSRERERNDKDGRESKEKKEHRKREHSSELASDVQQKRSKADESKKKPSQSSSAVTSSTSSSQQQSSGQSSNQTSSSSNKRSTKKHESSYDQKDDYQPNGSLNTSSSSNQSKAVDTSSKHRTGDDRRTSTSNSSYYSKDKK